MSQTKEKPTRYWIDKEIEKLNKLTFKSDKFSYSKDMTGYKLTYNNDGSEIGKRMSDKEFLSYLEFVTEVLKVRSE